MRESSYEIELRDPEVIDDDVAVGLLDGAPWTRFAALGDSLIAGAGDYAEGYRREYWVDRLTNVLASARPGLAALNVGVRDKLIGDVIDDQLPQVLRFRPDLVLVDGGGNDMFYESFDVTLTESRFEALVVALKSTGADVVTFTMFGMRQDLHLPEPAGSRLEGRMEAWQHAVRCVSQRQGTILIDFEANPAAGRPDLYSDDLIHLNTRGHAVAATQAIETLSSHLEGRR